MKKLLVFMMAALMLVALAVTGCGGEEKKAAEAPEKVLRVATEPTFAPFEFQEEGSDKLSGFDMDLIRAIGAKMGYKVEIANMGFDALIPALNTGNIDVAIAGMSITDERKQAVGMSDPYYTSGLIVMVQKDNNDIKSIEDLKGKRIAAQIGTTGAAKAHSVEGAVVTDAVINDSPVIGYYLAQGGSEVAKTVGDVMEAEQYGIAVKKDNTKLLEDINKALAELKKDGEYDKIYKTWFGEVKK